MINVLKEITPDYKIRTFDVDKDFVLQALGSQAKISHYDEYHALDCFKIDIIENKNDYQAYLYSLCESKEFIVGRPTAQMSFDEFVKFVIDWIIEKNTIEGYLFTLDLLDEALNDEQLEEKNPDIKIDGIRFS